MADFVEKLEREFIIAIQKMGEEIYRDSQRNVPKNSGQLKRSGYIRKLSNGIEIGYGSPSSKQLTRPQAVSSASIFLLRPFQKGVQRATAPSLTPSKHFLTKAVDRSLAQWGVRVGVHLQRTFGR